MAMATATAKATATASLSAVGVDLGGTKIEVALVDEAGRVIRRLRRPTEAEKGAAAVQGVIVSAVRELLAQGKDEAPIGVGVGVAGQVEQGTGAVRFAPNLKWRDVPLQADLAAALKMPVAVINDVRAGTWGEWIYGAGKGCDHVVCVFVGTGIGGGVVSGGRMLSGASNSAGELGHVTISIEGPPCHCGNRGCLEAFAGGWAIARRAQELVAADRTAGARMLQLADGKLECVAGKVVEQAFHSGDPLAVRLIEEVGTALGAGCVGLVNALNPQCLILGGGVSENIPELLGYVERRVRQYALAAATGSLRVLPAALHNEAGVVGAAAVVLRSATAPAVGTGTGGAVAAVAAGV